MIIFTAMPAGSAQRLLDATMGGRGLGLSIVDRRLGKLGNPISGRDCV